MKARQYKKLCKKAMELLVAMGADRNNFSEDCKDVVHRGKTLWPVVFGLNTGPDFDGEYDWHPAWTLLHENVINETADWDSYRGRAGDPDPYDKSICGTIRIFNWCRNKIKQLEVKPS